MRQFTFLTTGPDYAAPVLLAHFLSDLPKDSKVEVTHKVVRETRSLAQNRRYWSLIVPLVAEILSASRDIPISKDQAHYLLKASFIGVDETPLGMVPKSSKALDTPGFTEFMRKIEGWIATTYGVVIPERGEDLQ